MLHVVKNNDFYTEGACRIRTMQSIGKQTPAIRFFRYFRNRVLTLPIYSTISSMKLESSNEKSSRESSTFKTDDS